MPQSLIRNVIFDFGGVLVRWRPEEIIRQFYADEDLRDSLKQSVFQHPDWTLMDRGMLSEADAVERFAARIGRPRDEMVGLLQHVKDSLTPVAESFALVQALAKRGVPLYGLSNMSAPMFEYLRNRYDCWSAFRGIVISGEVKMIKPEPQIFDHIAQRYKLDPSATVFIDDHLPNIESAVRQGFRGIHFLHPQQCADELNALLDDGRHPALSVDSAAR